jgi:hypothetical protein
LSGAFTALGMLSGFKNTIIRYFAVFVQRQISIKLLRPVDENHSLHASHLKGFCFSAWRRWYQFYDLKYYSRIFEKKVEP